MNGPSCALITGISGQDGSYLAEFLVAKGYEVHGIDRDPLDRRGRTDAPGHGRLSAIRDSVTVHAADIRDRAALERILRECEPQEVYNLAAEAFVPDSFSRPGSVREINADGVLTLLEAVRDLAPEARFFQASSCEMFGNTPAPQSELTPFDPVSPYGQAKVVAHETVASFRDRCGMRCFAGISFNHESPRRDLRYVTRKVTDAAARIKLGLADSLALGNVEAKRDWGYAPEYVEAMWLMLNRGVEPADFVLATGRPHSVREMAEIAFECAGLRLDDHLCHDPELERASDPPNLAGDARKAREQLGWGPRTDLASLMRLMVDADLSRLAAEGRSRPLAQADSRR